MRASDKSICEKVDFGAFFCRFGDWRKKIIRDNGISSLLMFIVRLSKFQSLNNHGIKKKNITDEDWKKSTTWSRISAKFTEK